MFVYILFVVYMIELLKCLFISAIFYIFEQKKKEEEKAKEKELNDLFKVAVSQPKVPVGK